MPLAFESLIGGTITLIGTSPNLLISSVRQSLGGEPYRLFDGATKVLGQFLAATGTQAPDYIALAIMLAVSMLLTPFLHHASAVLVLGPVAAVVAETLGYNAGTFLMAVALGCACDFLMPIGHQNNLLVMGPGGYCFTHYWRLGLPLLLLVLLLGTPLIISAWPLR